MLFDDQDRPLHFSFLDVSRRESDVLSLRETTILEDETFLFDGAAASAEVLINFADEKPGGP